MGGQDSFDEQTASSSLAIAKVTRLCQSATPLCIETLDWPEATARMVFVEQLAIILLRQPGNKNETTARKDSAETADPLVSNHGEADWVVVQSRLRLLLLPS
jgi:hypothetical protein